MSTVNVIESHRPDQRQILSDRILLTDGFSVSREFFGAIRLQIEARLPELRRDHCYTAKKLAGKTFWALLERGEQRMAGRCIAYMVAHHFLPLAFVDSKHEFPKWYRLQ